MIIREMVASDLASVQQLYLTCCIATFNWRSPDEFKLEDFNKTTKGEWFLVAEQDGEIIGFSSVWEDHFLHNLFVAPSAHGQGIGTKLLAACFAGKLNTPARLKCVVRNTKACSFYEAKGWVIDEANVEDDPDNYHLYVFR